MERRLWKAWLLPRVSGSQEPRFSPHPYSRPVALVLHYISLLTSQRRLAVVMAGCSDLWSVLWLRHVLILGGFKTGNEITVFNGGSFKDVFSFLLSIDLGSSELLDNSDCVWFLCLNSLLHLLLHLLALRGSSFA